MCLLKYECKKLTGITSVRVGYALSGTVGTYAAFMIFLSTVNRLSVIAFVFAMTFLATSNRNAPLTVAKILTSVISFHKKSRGGWGC